MKLLEVIPPPGVLKSISRGRAERKGPSWSCPILTGLLLFGSARCLVGLAPDGDTVLQELQRPALLPVSRAHLQAQRSTLAQHGEGPLRAEGTHLQHAGALQHLPDVLVVLHPYDQTQQRQG